MIPDDYRPCIYKISNLVNLKCYIGFTGRGILARFSSHKREAMTGKIGVLYSAIRKYGPENFKIEPLIYHENKDYTLNVLEPFFIKKYDSIRNGYNVRPGGGGIYEASPIMRPVLQIKHGLILNEFPSLAEAGRHVGISGDVVGMCARKKKDFKTGSERLHGGFLWAYKDDPETIKKYLAVKFPKKPYAKIYQLCPNGTTINTFPSREVAFKVTGIKIPKREDVKEVNGLCDMCKVGEFYWVYK